jgi:hypothetical protein
MGNTFQPKRFWSPMAPGCEACCRYRLNLTRDKVCPCACQKTVRRFFDVSCLPKIRTLSPKLMDELSLEPLLRLEVTIRMSLLPVLCTFCRMPWNWSLDLPICQWKKPGLDCVLRLPTRHPFWGKVLERICSWQVAIGEMESCWRPNRENSWRPSSSVVGPML